MRRSNNQPINETSEHFELILNWLRQANMQAIRSYLQQHIYNNIATEINIYDKTLLIYAVTECTDATYLEFLEFLAEYITQHQLDTIFLDKICKLKYPSPLLTALQSKNSLKIYTLLNFIKAFNHSPDFIVLEQASQLGNSAAVNYLLTLGVKPTARYLEKITNNPEIILTAAEFGYLLGAQINNHHNSIYTAARQKPLLFIGTIENGQTILSKLGINIEQASRELQLANLTNGIANTNEEDRRQLINNLKLNHSLFYHQEAKNILWLAIAPLGHPHQQLFKEQVTNFCNNLTVAQRLLLTNFDCTLALINNRKKSAIINSLISALPNHETRRSTMYASMEPQQLLAPAGTDNDGDPILLKIINEFQALHYEAIAGEKQHKKFYRNLYATVLITSCLMPTLAGSLPLIFFINTWSSKNLIFILAAVYCAAILATVILTNLLYLICAHCHYQTNFTTPCNDTLMRPLYFSQLLAKYYENLANKSYPQSGLKQLAENLQRASAEELSKSTWKINNNSHNCGRFFQQLRQHVINLLPIIESLTLINAISHELNPDGLLPEDFQSTDCYEKHQFVIRLKNLAVATDLNDLDFQTQLLEMEAIENPVHMAL